MKKIKNLVIGGIQNKIFNLVFFNIIFFLLALVGITIYQSRMLTNIVEDTNDKQVESMTTISAETMDNVINANLGRTTALDAYIADDLFSDLESNVWMLCDFATKLYSDDNKYPGKDVSVPDKSNEGKTSVQLLYESGVDISDPEYAEEIRLLGNMSDLMIALFDSKAQLNSCFIGTQSGLMVITDQVPSSKYVSEDEIMDFPVTERPWFIGAKETGKIFFSDVEVDAFSGRLGIVCSMPVYDERGKLTAVVGADLFLNSMEEAVTTSEQYGGFVCIINQYGHTVFAPEGHKIFEVHSSDDATDLRESSDTELAEFVKAVLDGNTDVHLVKTSEGDYYMSGATIPTVGWAVVSVASKEQVDTPTSMLTSVRMRFRFTTDSK